MQHEMRCTAQKIANRLKLIEPLEYARRVVNIIEENQEALAVEGSTLRLATEHA